MFRVIGQEMSQALEAAGQINKLWSKPRHLSVDHCGRTEMHSFVSWLVPAK